jgi:hypothetical protein
MACPETDNPPAAIFALEFRRELYTVYDQNVKSEGTKRQWCRCSKMGEQMFMMGSEVVSRLCIVTDFLVQSVNKKNCERLLFTISELLCEFLQISYTVLYKIITLG